MIFLKESAENYLETILMLEKRIGKVKAIDISKETGFTKPSVSVALKKLKADNYIDNTGGYIILTEKGKVAAERVLERHYIITEALEKIGVPYDIAAEDACKVEHILNDITFEQIKLYVEKTK